MIKKFLITSFFCSISVSIAACGVSGQNAGLTDAQNKLLGKIKTEFGSDFTSIEKDALESGKLAEYLDTLQSGLDIEVENDVQNTLAWFEESELKRNDNISTVRKKADEYMDIHYSDIELDTPEFNNLVTNLVVSDESDIEKTAGKDITSRAFYMYAIIYSDNDMKYDDSLNNITVEEYIRRDKESDYLKNHVPVIFSEKTLQPTTTK